MFGRERRRSVLREMVSVVRSNMCWLLLFQRVEDLWFFDKRDNSQFGEIANYMYICSNVQ